MPFGNNVTTSIAIRVRAGRSELVVKGRKLRCALVWASHPTPQPHVSQVPPTFERQAKAAR
jgi:hypothetical protein